MKDLNQGFKNEIALLKNSLRKASESQDRFSKVLTYLALLQIVVMMVQFMFAAQTSGNLWLSILYVGLICVFAWHISNFIKNL